MAEPGSLIDPSCIRFDPAPGIPTMILQTLSISETLPNFGPP